MELKPTVAGIPPRAFPALDALRGIAALLVALFHFRGNFLGFNNYPSGDGYLAVDMFFVLSGFVLSHAYLSRFERGMSVGQFVRIRLIRLYPLYLVGLLLAMANILLGMEPTGDLTKAGLLQAFTLELFMLPSWPTVRDQLFMINPVSWSLFFELMVNILFVMLWRRLTPKFLWSVISASGMVIAAFTLYRHNASMGNFWRTSPIGVARTFFSFGLGILIYYGYRSGRLRVHAPLPVFLLAAAVLIIYLLIPVPPRIRACYDLAFIFLVAPTLVMIGASRHLENRWMGIFSFLGATSYALYATHANLIPLVMTLSARTFAAPPVWLISIASVCVATLLAYLLDMVYDKPVRSALAASFARNQPGRAIRT